MITAIIILSLLFIVLIFSNNSAYKKARRIRKLKKLSSELGTKPATTYNEERKTALNIPGYYEDITHKGKLKKTYKWELHESI